MINVTQTFMPPLEEYVAQLQRIWESKWLTNYGILYTELQEKLAEFLKIKQLLLVNNGTIALQVAIKSLELKGEIITTPFSYVATTSSIVWENCQPVFVDIDEDYLTIDETKIEDAITAKTSAILATHVYGNPCAVEAIEKIAKRHNLRIIYDAAHCFAVEYQNRSILDWGDVSILSFHATKLFHTGEGGAIVCNDDALAEKIFYHQNFGHDGPERFFGLGVNGKISELNAAMGLAVLPYIEEIIARRRKICETYDDFLDGANLQKLKIRGGTKFNYAYYPIICPSEETLLKTQRALNENDIFPRRYFYPSLNRLPYLRYEKMPVAEDISRKILCLPLSADLMEKDVKKITEIILRDGVVK